MPGHQTGDDGETIQFLLSPAMKKCAIMAGPKFWLDDSKKRIAHGPHFPHQNYGLRDPLTTRYSAPDFAP